ncbi:LOW QUALITY PROTEIN: hypothetical protein HJC23_012959, partial [Cyclotella cryptica]
AKAKAALLTVLSRTRSHENWSSTIPVIVDPRQMSSTTLPNSKIIPLMDLNMIFSTAQPSPACPNSTQVSSLTILYVNYVQHFPNCDILIFHDPTDAPSCKGDLTKESTSIEISSTGWTMVATAPLTDLTAIQEMETTSIQCWLLTKDSLVRCVDLHSFHAHGR